VFNTKLHMSYSCWQLFDCRSCCPAQLLLLLSTIAAHTLNCQEFLTMAFASRSLARRSGEQLVALGERATMSCGGNATRLMSVLRHESKQKQTTQRSMQSRLSVVSRWLDAATGMIHDNE
jgi:hypothetical protein